MHRATFPFIFQTNPTITTLNDSINFSPQFSQGRKIRFSKFASRLPVKWSSCIQDDPGSCQSNWIQRQTEFRRRRWKKARKRNSQINRQLNWSKQPTIYTSYRFNLWIILLVGISFLICRWFLSKRYWIVVVVVVAGLEILSAPRHITIIIISLLLRADHCRWHRRHIVRFDSSRWSSSTSSPFMLSHQFEMNNETALFSCWQFLLLLSSRYNFRITQQ